MNMMFKKLWKKIKKNKKNTKEKNEIDEDEGYYPKYTPSFFFPM